MKSLIHALLSDGPSGAEEDYIKLVSKNVAIQSTFQTSSASLVIIRFHVFELTSDDAS